MTQMTGGEAVVQSLINHDVKTLFGLPGVQNDYLFNALFDAQDEIKTIVTRHEQGAAYMALGAAVSTGRPAVFSVVPGPGFLNAAAALSTAYALNEKVLALVGQIPTDKLEKREGVLHEINDQLGIMQRLTKWSARVTSPQQAPSLVAEAFRQLYTERPRPVGLEIPMDVLKSKAEVALDFDGGEAFSPLVDLDQINLAAKALGEAKNPIIYVGNGALGVADAVKTLAEMLQAPVVGYRTGRGVLDYRHPLAHNLHGSHPLWKTADVVLAIGTHMRIPLRSWGVDEEMTIIRIDVDPTAHNIFATPNIAITARAEDALPALVAKTAVHNKKRPNRSDEMAQVKAVWDKMTAYLEPQKSYLKIIRDALGEDGIFVDDLTQVGFAARMIYPVYKPRTYITPGYQGTLGYGFPTALGAKVANPDVPVISITGDGGFMFSPQSLATAVQHQIGVVCILFNNNQFGNVQQMQRGLYGGRVIATDLVNPDFVKMAEAFGAQGLRAESPQGLKTAVEKGLATAGPTLIEVPIGDVESIDRLRKLPRIRGQ